MTTLCDISSFYSVNGGGVKTYHERKMRYFANGSAHKYIMVVPADRNAVLETDYGKQYRVRGFRVSRDGAYRQIYDYPFLSHILKTEKPDVLELGSCYLDSWLARIGAGSVPVLSGFYHADFPDSYIMPALKGIPSILSDPVVHFWRRYVAFAYRKLDATIVASNYMLEKLAAFGIANARQVPLGVDTDRFTPDRRDAAVRRSFGVGDGDKLLLFAGRFGGEKGTRVLAEALPAIAEMDRAHVVLVGTGPLRPMIDAAAEGRPNIHVVDFIHDRERLATLYASADGFLSPGPYETFGLSTLEAMSAGVPVVAAASGGAGELVRKCEGGLRFTPGDAEDFAGRVRRLLASDGAAIGRRARERVLTHFSWDRTFDRLLEVYRELLTQKTLVKKAS